MPTKREKMRSRREAKTEEQEKEKRPQSCRIGA